jgi:hypothetical protein
VIVCSDSISAGENEDRAGKVIIQKLEAHQVGIEDYVIIPDEKEKIQELVKTKCDAGVNLNSYRWHRPFPKRCHARSYPSATGKAYSRG